jgi:hypothetical protein
MKNTFLQAFGCLAMFLCVNHAQAQDQNPPIRKNEETQKPPIQISPNSGSQDTPSTITYNTGQSLSPTTQNLVNSINASVNLYTGTANVSIPICSLPAENISLPISLNYVAGNGIKIEDDTKGYVGQGWTLQAGGMISRMVRGLPDEDNNGFSGIHNIGAKAEKLLNNYMADSEKEEYYNKVMNNEWDSEADIFYFVLPTGLSGKFVLQANGIPVTIPYQPITIKPAMGRAATQNYWEIITQDGMSYKFGMNDLSKETTSELTSIPVKPSRSNGGVETKTKTYTSTWFVNNVTNIEGKILANFDYYVPLYVLWDRYNPNPPPIPRSKSHTRYSQHQFYHKVGAGDCILLGVRKISITNTVNEIKMLGKITTDFGMVEFSKIDNNCGVIYPTPTTPSICAANLIRTITLTTSQGDIRKSWNLKYDFFADNQRIKLTEVKANDAPATQLFYNENYTMPVPNTLSVQQDWWGYYNNNTHTSLLPSYNGQAGANRNPDESKTQTYILNKIVNPLGAVTELDYENHRYDDNGTQKIVGGLRVKAIRHKLNGSPQAKTQVRNYIYTRDVNNTTLSNGVLLPKEGANSLENNYIISCSGDITAYDRQNSSLLQVVSSADYVAYHTVTEKVIGSGKTNHHFSSALTDSDVYNPSYIIQAPNSPIWSYNFMTRSTNSLQGRRGLPTRIMIFDEAGNIVTDKFNFYAFNYHNQVKSVKMGNSGDLPSQAYSGYADLSESISLTRTEEYIYDQKHPLGYQAVSATDNLQSVATYSYTADRQIKEVRKTLPTGEILVTKTNYAKDVMTGAACLADKELCLQACPPPIDVDCARDCQTAYVDCQQNYTAGVNSDEMAAALQKLLTLKLNPPVETQTWIEKSGEPARLLSASLTTYKLFGNFGEYVRAYQNFQLKIRANQLPTEQDFLGARVDGYSGLFVKDLQYELLETNTYNQEGLAAENTPKNALTSTVIYDLYKTPVAKVLNAKNNQVFFSSFEDTDLGLLGLTTDTDSKTGKWAWDLTNRAYNISAQQITDPNTMYVLSYWKKETGSTTWQYHETTLTYQALINTTITGNGLLDEVRIHPPTAMMTTMTYKAMVGKTSETDANNRTVYYEYDNLHRLQYVKDEKQNILEAYQYNVTR